MAKCEVINLTLSDGDSDSDFIQAKKATVEPTNVQDCHNMSKLYLVHFRPLGLHGVFLVAL